MQTPLVLMPFPANDLQLAATAGLNLLRLWQDPDPAQTLEKHGPHVRVLANTGENPVDAELMNQLPNLELICQFGVGYDSVDIVEAVRRGILVSNVAGSNAEEVADTCLGLLLMTVRQLGRAEQYLRSGRWSAEGSFPRVPSSLQGRTLGLLGIGNVGQAVARRATAFGMPVAYHARTERAVEYRYYPSLIELAKAVDTLVVAAPGGPATRHLIDAEVLSALGPQGVLINVSRGSLVDELALISALRSKRILAAGLDVYEREPHVPQGLLTLDNAVLLPHVGSSSIPTREAMAKCAVDNITAWFSRRTLLNPVPEVQSLLRAD